MSQWNDPQQRQPRYDDPTAAYGPPQQPPRGGRGGYPGNNPFGTEGNEQFGIAGMVLALLGGILLIVCFTSLEWFNTSNGNIDVSYSFGEIGDRLDSAGDAAGFASAYFGWFAWTFFVIALIAAIGSSFPSPALRAARVVGTVTAFAAAGLSFLALQVTDSRSYLDWLKDARIGFWLGVVGFVVIGVGAAIGPRKV